MEEAAHCVEVEGNECPANGVFDWLERPDGHRLRFAYWKSPGAHRGTIVLLLGRTEFIEKYLETIEDLLSRDFSVVIMDPRGQGLSSRHLLGQKVGHVESFDEYVDDFQALMEEVVRSLFSPPYIMLGHSMGSHVGLRYLHDHEGVFDQAVLVSPMTSIKTKPLPPGVTDVLVRGAALVFGKDRTTSSIKA